MANERIYITVPDFQYSGDYFPQLAARLRLWGRSNAPEITNEDPKEPFIQGERAFALIGHYNNVLLDMVANSLYLRTATLPESVKLILELINYKLLPAGPGKVDMVGELNTTYATTQRLLETYRKFATKRTPDEPEVIFENPSALDLTHRTDEQGLAYAYGLQYLDAGSGVLSSLESDIVYDSSAPWTDSHLNQYISIRNSTIGNDVENLRIIELLDADGGSYRKVRLKGASFISEIPVTWELKTITSNGSTNLNTGVEFEPHPRTMTIGEVSFPQPYVINDAFYFGHPDIMMDRIDITHQTNPTSPSWTSVIEFYDPTDSTISPDIVSVGSSTMTFTLTTLLGTENCSDAIVEVMHIPTGATYRGYSTWSGTNRLVINGFLDQSNPSDSETDYIVSAKWRPVTVETDTTTNGSAFWGQSGYTEFELPQSQTDSWYKSRLYDHDDGEEKLAFFLRWRILTAGDTPTSFNRLRIDQRKQYAIMNMVQGQTVEDSPLGSSNGQADQQFVLTRKPYVLASGRMFVDEGGGEFEWTVVDSLVTSRSTDRHVQIEPLPNGTAVARFGDGTNGRIPPIGTNNLRGIYRINADEDGNIGANTLTVNRDGVGVFRRVWNPRQGKFWIEADWASRAALERAKVRGPRLLRTMYRAVAPYDIETLSTSFKNINGVRPVRRAKVYEEAFGPKTVEVVVAGGAGAALSSDDKEELAEYFNGGDTYGYPGVLVVNHELTVTNYSPRSIPIQIRIEAYPIITEALVKQVLTSLLSPTSIDRSGRNYLWRFGQNVPLSRIESEIFQISPSNIFDVDVLSPTEDITLTDRELPLLDVVNSQVVIIPPSFITT